MKDLGFAFDQASPQDIVSWAVGRFGRRLAVACSFGGPSGVAMLDMALKADPTVSVYYLDTGLLFPQTYEHIAQIAQHYGITPLPIRPEFSVSEQAMRFGPNLWDRNPDRCCEIRKIEPQREFLRGYSAWMSGIRRDQSPTRRNAKAVEWDSKFDLVKVCPLASWSEERVWTYIKQYRVPYNPLLDQGYRSIGCATCTLRVQSNEDPRAGRWPGFSKTECGLHATEQRPAS